MEKEIWKEIDGDYFISNLGRIKSFKRYREGKIFNISQQTISRIKNNKIWNHVNLEEAI